MMMLNNHSINAHTHCDNACLGLRANGHTRDKE